MLVSDLQLRQAVIDELAFEPSVNAAHIGVVMDIICLQAMECLS